MTVKFCLNFSFKAIKNWLNMSPYSIWPVDRVKTRCAWRSGFYVNQEWPLFSDVWAMMNMHEN